MAKKKRIVIGIDPGKKGAIAFRMGNDLPIIYDMPILNDSYDLFALGELFKDLSKEGNVSAAIEKQQAFPGQGVKSMFTLGYGFGALEMGLSGFHIPYEIVRATDWRRGLGIPQSKDATKRKSDSIAFARRKYPDLYEQLLVSKDGRSDALNIMEWKRKEMKHDRDATRSARKKRNPRRKKNRRNSH